MTRLWEKLGCGRLNKTSAPHSVMHGVLFRIGREILSDEERESRTLDTIEA